MARVSTAVLWGIWLATVIGAAWLASSVAAMLGGPAAATAALTAGGLVALAALWSAASSRRRAWAVAARGLLLAVLGVAGIFGLLGADAARAVATRGDWFLDGRTAAWAAPVREATLEAADVVVWAHRRLAGNRAARDLSSGAEVATPAPLPAAPSGVAGPGQDDLRSGGAATSGGAAAPPQVGADSGSDEQGDLRSGGTGPLGGVSPGVAAPDAHADDGEAPPSNREGELLLTNRGGELRWSDQEPLPEAGLTLIPAAPRGPDTAPERPSASVPPRALGWPHDGEVRRAVARITGAAARTPESLAAAIMAASSTPQERLRVLHDWMATHVTYDDLAWAAQEAVPSDPQDVLTSRRAVCAGYARLFVAVATHLGVEAAYVVGRARKATGVEDHAWNAVRLSSGSWSLVDVTWDATKWTSGRTQPFSTDYFLTPPETFGVDHSPEDARWQLRDAPVSAVGFLRQPLTLPVLARHGVGWVAPDRAEVAGARRVTVALRNPYHRHLLATVAPAEAGPDARGTQCGEGSVAAEVNLTCTVPASGRHLIKVWVGLAPIGVQTLAALLWVDPGV